MPVLRLVITENDPCAFLLTPIFSSDPSFLSAREECDALAKLAAYRVRRLQNRNTENDAEVISAAVHLHKHFHVARNGSYDPRRPLVALASNDKTVKVKAGAESVAVIDGAKLCGITMFGRTSLQDVAGTLRKLIDTLLHKAAT